MDEQRQAATSLLANMIARREYHLVRSDACHDQSPRHYQEWYAANASVTAALAMLRLVCSDDEARAIYAQARRDANETLARMDTYDPLTLVDA